MWHFSKISVLQRLMLAFKNCASPQKNPLLGIMRSVIRGLLVLMQYWRSRCCSSLMYPSRAVGSTDASCKNLNIDVISGTGCINICAGYVAMFTCIPNYVESGSKACCKSRPRLSKAQVFFKPRPNGLEATRHNWLLSRIESVCTC